MNCFRRGKKTNSLGHGPGSPPLLWRPNMRGGNSSMPRLKRGFCVADAAAVVVVDVVLETPTMGLVTFYFPRLLLFNTNEYVSRSLSLIFSLFSCCASIIVWRNSPHLYIISLLFLINLLSSYPL